MDFIEILAAGRRKLKRVLAEIGFEEKGRYFRHTDTDYFLEFPSGALAVGGEPPAEIRVLRFETGELTALSPTDCIKDRLTAYFHWKDQQCLEQALLVAASIDIDLSEIERWSKREGQEKKFGEFRSLLAMKSSKTFHRRKNDGKEY